MISVSHNLIVNLISKQREQFDKFTLDVTVEMFQTPKTLQERISIFKYKYAIYYELSMQAYQIIKKHVNNVKENISWIDLKNEPILEFKIPNVDNEINAPFVTDEGITVYPDGTRVDKKGTIL